jgi:protein ImuB
LIAAVVVRDATETLHARSLITLRALLPHVGVVATGTFACDLAGTERVLGAPSRIARRILERLTRIGAHASVGVALTPFAARVAAERTGSGETRLVTDAREYLVPLPLDVLPLDEKLRDELGLLGLRTVGDFAGLPRGAVFDRFGRGAARAHALARAEDEERVHADPPPRRIYARRLWEEPLASKDQLVFALRTALDEISAALAADGLAALRLAVKLDREDDEPLRLERSVLPPTSESAALLRSLRWALEERAHIGRVIGCAVEVREAEPARGRQIGLFAADGARWEEAIASARYLREKLGTGRVLRARVADADARLPERAADWKEVIT